MPFAPTVGCEFAARFVEQVVTACWCVMAVALKVAVAVSLATSDPPRR